MLAAVPNGNTMNLTTTASEEGQQLQDLESLAERIRALEKLLAAPAAPTSRSPLLLSSSSLLSGGAVNESTSPTEEMPEDIVGTLSSSPRQGDTQQQQQQRHYSQGNRHHGQHSQQQQAYNTPGSLSRRVQKIETSLRAVVKERKPMDEFLQKCESFKLISSPYSSHSDRELLSLQAKMELILAAQDDLQKLAEEAKEIQSLEQCAEIGGLKNVESQYPALSKLETIHIDQFKEANKVSDRTNKLTDDYNTLINTLSEVFLSWDALLAAAEHRLTEVERARS
ncbi:hypothetical protein BGZ98_008529 [Dissophora globulifera]|nr:hypothetical protein BGZ98_008529 [Dissophora globulifera]